MILVPRQLRRSDFPSSVPYYGGRLTPQVIAGLERHPTAASPPPAGLAPGATEMTSQQLETLSELRAQGVLTEEEFDRARRRLLGGS